MSKYVIELRPDCKVVQQICESDGRFCIGSKSIEYLEELNADYVNEHFGSLQDDAYQRGLEDGKWKSEDGCTGCKYEGKTGEHIPCDYCMNNFKNQWTAKSDKIEVGDEVKWNSDLIVVTRLYENGDFDWCDGIGNDGTAFHILEKNARKTGRHFDIKSILEDMRHD